MTGGAGSAARAHVATLLDAAAAERRPIAFWWRDDDAVAATPALDRLLALADRYGLPIALAVIPASADESLARRLEGEPQAAVLQHGWNHANHAASGKSIELGGERPVGEILSDLKRGRDRLQALMPAQFLPILVPPWNRIADPVRDARESAGLSGFSTFGPATAGARHQVNVHLDIFEWRPVRRPIVNEEGCRRLAAEIERRLAGSAEPIGLMTHHLVHEEASWALLQDLLELIAAHPGAVWPPIAELFGLAASSASADTAGTTRRSA